MPLNTLAWFLKGDIGLSELSGKVDLATTGPTSGFRSLTPSSLAYVWVMTGARNKDHYQLLLLLLEKGCRLDCKVKHKGKEMSRFRVFLETSLQSSISTHASDMLYVTRFCQQLVYVGRMRDLSPQYRFFLTGRARLHVGGLPDQARGSEDASDWNDFPTTALHEAVLANSQAAVAASLRTDFGVNARDGAGMSAVQLAIHLSKEISGQFVNKTLALLRQDKRIVWDTADTKASDNDPPLGWRCVTATIERDLMNGYFEKLSGSFTLHPPFFSFLDQQRLTLGFRRNLSYTYALDPLRFLRRKEDQTPTPAIRHKTSLIFDDDWYEREIYGDHKDDELYLHLESKLDKPSFMVAAFSKTWAKLSSVVTSASISITSASWRAWDSLEDSMTAAFSEISDLLSISMMTAISKLRALILTPDFDALLCLIPLNVLADFRHWAPLPRLMLSALPFISLNGWIPGLTTALLYYGRERAHLLGVVTVFSQLHCNPECFVGFPLGICAHWLIFTGRTFSASVRPAHHTELPPFCQSDYEVAAGQYSIRALRIFTDVSVAWIDHRSNCMQATKTCAHEVNHHATTESPFPRCDTLRISGLGQHFYLSDKPGATAERNCYDTLDALCSVAMGPPQILREPRRR